MVRNPLLEKMKQNKPALGINSQNPHEAELLAKIGFDYFRVDHMWTDTDWRDTQTLVWACEAAGITPVIRIHTNPWIGYDHRLAVDVGRAQGIGFQFITVNYADKKSIDEAVQVAKDWHRRPMTVFPFKNAKNWDADAEKIAQQTFIVALAETKEMLERCEEVISMPEIKMFFISGTDGGRMLLGQQSPVWGDPRFWKHVKRIVDLCEKHGVYVGMNPSYCDSLTEIRERTKRLIDNGIKMIMVQTTPFILQLALNEFMDKLRKDVGE